MATIQENKVTPEWVDDLYQIEMTDPVTGGSDGVANRQAKQLGQRTQWLKQKVEGLKAEGSDKKSGLLRLSSDIESESESVAATPKAVSRVNKKINDVAAQVKTEIIVNSIAALRQVNDLLVVRAQVYSYHDGGTTGGGFFFVDPADKLSVDNGGTIIVSSDGRRWRRQESQTLSLRDFGAHGDGKTDDTTAVMSAIATGVALEGNGLVYLVSHLPDMRHLKHACFKYAGMLYPTVDFLEVDVAKATNSVAYTAWPQDSAYVLNNQIKVWVNHTSAHYSSSIVPGYFLSEDGGTTYQELTILDPTIEKHSVWCAGIAHGVEYIFVRTSDNAPWRYKLYKRKVPSHLAGVDSYFTDYEISDVTFPNPNWASAYDQPLMIHSFAETPEGFVIGASFSEGAGLYRTKDGGGSWEFVTLNINSDSEEPTVAYADGVFCGFLRGGSNGSKPRFWISRDDLLTVEVYSSPGGLFGANNFQDACVPLKIIDGVVHAFSAQRSGTLAALDDDRDTPIYYIRADLSAGDNIWAHAEIFHLGYIFHAENGGASAYGQGSVLVYGDKLFYFFGSEERTGNDTAENRTANIWHLALPLKKRHGLTDWRSTFAKNRSHRGFMKSLWLGGYMFDPGRLVGHTVRKMSSKFKSVPRNAALQLDGRSGNVSIYATSDGGWATFYSIGDSGKTSGLRVDNTNGNVAIITAGSELIRFESTTQMLRPAVDNTVSLGAGGARFTELHAATGTINTSDARLKQDIQPIDEVLMRAWLSVNWRQYRWRDAVEIKGNGARIHLGLIAQEIEEAFEKHGLNPYDYGLLCKEQWRAEDKIPSEVGADGTVLTAPYLGCDSGERLGIRFDECMALEAATQRWLLSKLLSLESI